MTADSLIPVKWPKAMAGIVPAMDDLFVTAEVTIPAAELRWRFDPTGGPGGQHANKSATRAELSFDVSASMAFSSSLQQRVLERLQSQLTEGVLTVQVSESRSQWRNRQLARQRMADTLRAALQPPPPPRRSTRARAGRPGPRGRGGPPWRRSSTAPWAAGPGC